MVPPGQRSGELVCLEKVSALLRIFVWFAVCFLSCGVWLDICDLVMQSQDG